MANETKIEQYVDIEGLRQLLTLIKQTYVCQHGLTAKVREQIRLILDEMGSTTTVKQTKADDRTDPNIIAADFDVEWKNGDLLCVENTAEHMSVFYWQNARWICISKAPVNEIDITSSEVELKKLIPTAAAAINATEKLIERAHKKEVKYEVMPINGMVVDYRDREIRINTENVLLSTPNRDNAFYIEIRAYAPEGTVYWKEWDGIDFETNSGGTMATKTPADTNGFVGIDEYGNVYSKFYCMIGSYNTQTNKWTNIGKNSTIDKYLGFKYKFEWYGKENKILKSEALRIILTNNSCHLDLVPDVINQRIIKKVEEITITGGETPIATSDRAGKVRPNADEFTVDGTQLGLMTINKVPVGKITGLDEKIKSIAYTKEEVNHIILSGSNASSLATIVAKNINDLNNNYKGEAVGTIAIIEGTNEVYILNDSTATSDRKEWHPVSNPTVSLIEKIEELETKTDSSGTWDTF